TRFSRDWSSDVCSSDLLYGPEASTNAKNTGLNVPDPCPSPLIVIRLLRDTPKRHAVHPIRQLAPALRDTIHRMPRAPVAAPVARSEERRVGKEERVHRM